MLAIDSRGSIRSISSAGDSFLFLSIVATPFFYYGIRAHPVFPWFVLFAFIVALAAFIVMFTIGAAYQYVSRSRLGGKRLVDGDYPPIQDLVSEVASAIGIKPPKVWWIPNDPSVGARVYGFIAQEVLVTGGLAVLSATDRSRARAIVAHELGHLQNRDPILFMLMVITGWQIIAAWSALRDEFSKLDIADAAEIEPGAEFILLVTFALRVVYPTVVMIWAFRRRERYADAVAINALDSHSEYLEMLEKSKHAGSVFHPGKRDRVASIRESSSVLRTSPGLLVLVAMSSLAMITFAIPEVYDQANYAFARKGCFPRIYDDCTMINMLGASVMLLSFQALAVICELRKGIRPKRPALLPEILRAQS